MPPIQIKTKRIYEPASEDDGFRLLVMRLWPRGIRKDSISRWEKELAPSVELLKDFRSRTVEWQEFCTRYVAEVSKKTDLLGWLRRKASEGQVTLLCGCEDESRCHRTLLKDILLQN